MLRPSLALLSGGGTSIKFWEKGEGLASRAGQDSVPLLSRVWRGSPLAAKFFFFAQEELETKDISPRVMSRHQVAARQREHAKAWGHHVFASGILHARREIGHHRGRKKGNLVCLVDEGRASDFLQ